MSFFTVSFSRFAPSRITCLKKLNVSSASLILPCDTSQDSLKNLTEIVLIHLFRWALAFRLIWCLHFAFWQVDKQSQTAFRTCPGHPAKGVPGNFLGEFRAGTVGTVAIKYVALSVFWVTVMCRPWSCMVVFLMASCGHLGSAAQSPLRSCLLWMPDRELWRSRTATGDLDQSCSGHVEH